MTGNMPGANTNINGLDGPMTQELHLKMSKKIAQLTKVVYALNTKNDEHDAHIACLQEAHEMELKKIISGTDDRLSKLHTMLSQQRNDKEIILDLKQRLKEFETHNSTAVRDFKNYKSQMQGKEVELMRGCDEQLKVLRGELERLRDDYHEKVSEFTEKSSKNDVSSSMMLAMKEKHGKELELLREVNEMLVKESDRVQNEMKKGFDKEIHQLKIKHREELSQMVSSEKSSLTALYKTQIVQLEEEVSTLKQVMNQSDSQSKHKLDMYRTELTDMENKFKTFGTDKDELEAENAALQKEVTDLEEKFMETRRDLDLSLQRIHEVERILAEERNRSLCEAEDSMKKTGQIGMLAELQQAHSVENQKLQFEIKKLQDRVHDKEGEIKLLKEKQQRTINIWEEKCNDLKKDLILKDEEMLRQVTEYKIGLEENGTFYEEREKELHQLKLEEIKIIKEACEQQIEEVIEVTRANSNAIREALEAEALDEKMDLTSRYEEKISILAKERDSLSVQVNSLQQTVDTLNNAITDNQSTIIEYEKERQQLYLKVSGLQTHLEGLAEELKDKIKTMQTLRLEFDKEVNAHKNTKNTLEHVANERVAVAVNELNETWQARLKEELNALELELSRRQSQSRNSEIKRIKNTHMIAYQEAEKNFLEQIDTLKDKVSVLEKQSSLQNIQSLKKEMNQNENSRAEYEALSYRITELKTEHAQNIKDLEQEHLEKMKRLEESMKKDAKHLEDKLITAHRHNMHELSKANKLSVNILKDQLEQKRLMDMNTTKNLAKAELEKNMARFRKEFEEEIELKLHELNTQHGEQTEELQREVEMRDREMKQFHSQVAELQCDITDKAAALNRAADAIEELRNEIDRLNDKVDRKCKEVMTTKQEAVIQIKKREKKLALLHQSEVSSLNVKFNKHYEETIFKHQNEIEAMRLQMAELNTLFTAAEERYENRPSRPEDIAAIEELKGVIVECEEKIKQLINEKRYYELELVNREVNYNKVFNTSPKIGIMNPLGKGAANMKVQRKSETRIANQSSPKIASSFSSPTLKTNLRQPKLIPISSRTSSQESLTRLPNGPAKPLPPTNHLVKNAFLDQSLDHAVSAN